MPLRKPEEDREGHQRGDGHVPAALAVAGSMGVGVMGGDGLGAKMPTRPRRSPQVSRQGPRGSIRVRKGGTLN